MTLQTGNTQYAALIKSQYLPPPLESQYLSLFDIQVKMAKEFIEGTQDQKIQIIKRRIKKFFDYGNQPFQNLNQQEQSISKGKSNEPFQLNPQALKSGLQIDPTKLIVFGKNGLGYQRAEQILNGFICFQKIDGSNLRLTFPTIKSCQKILYNCVKEKSVIVAEHINYPMEIEWFELEVKKQIQGESETQDSLYARFATNKDDILFQNDNYFRKLLGKVRELTDRKSIQNTERQKELKEKVGKHKARVLQKRKFISKNNHFKKNRQEEDDKITVWEGCFAQSFSSVPQPIRNRQTYFTQSFPEKNCYNNESFQLKNLDISQIRAQQPIELEVNFKPRREIGKKFDRSLLNDQIDFRSKKPQQMPFYSSRDQMIKCHRQKEMPTSGKGFTLSQYDFDANLDRRMSRIEKKGSNTFLKIDN